MHKKITKPLLVLALIWVAIFLFSSFPSDASATEQDTKFEVNVSEVLSIRITTPSSWASGSAGTFLRNEVTLNVASNNSQGFTASMVTSDTNAELKHSSKNTSISTLSSGTSYTCTDNTTCPEFPDNKWGYTIDDGASFNTYHPMAGSSSSPISLISNAESTQQNPITSRDIYFSTKSDISQTSGTYSGTVVFYVVSGAIVANQNPVIPANPAEDGPENNAIFSNGRTIYTTSTEANNTVSTTTTINQGNALDSYQDPAGVTNDTNVYDSSMLATGLAVTASIAAASGATFFALAKGKNGSGEE